MQRLSFLLGALSSVAFGQTAQAPIPDFRLERLQLNAGAAKGITTASGDLLEKGEFRFALSGDYQNDPFTVRITPNAAQFGVNENTSLIGHRWTARLQAAYAPLSWLQVGFAGAYVPYQRGGTLSSVGITSPVRSGFAAPELNARVGLLSVGEAGLVESLPIDLALQLGVYLPLGTPGGLFFDKTVAVHPRVSAGRDLGPIRLGLELSTELRGAVDFNPSLDTGDDVNGSEFHVGAMVATTREFSKALRLEVAGRGDFAFKGTHPTSAEVMAAVNVPVGPVELFALGAGGFGSVHGLPRYRGMLGVSLTLPQAAPKPAVVAPPPTPEPAPVVVKAEPPKDTDSDGLADALDACPSVAGQPRWKGCPPPDADGDSITDADDACPAEKGIAALKGCARHDADGDGIEDAKDNCPNEAGIAENQGCKAKQLVKLTSDTIDLGGSVQFETGKAVLLPVSFPLLDNSASVLAAHPELQKLVIEGHTDNVGNAEANRVLSQARAQSVVAYLVKKGVAAERLEAKGFGQRMPIADNATSEGRAKNRRVEFRVKESAPTER